ncbi:hypothetical protein GCM10009710_22150 [Aeromicrobium alkaliterrae]|uniref:Uncharacterized protein n=1 Tax=Aeromicrobium alkaliterrae TaxID=302168 RepID=A0ABP4VY07_9ACTN
MRGELGGDVLEEVVGHREQQDVTRARDVGGIEHRHAVKQRAGPEAGGLGSGADGDDGVTRGAETSTEHGTDAAGTDDAHRGDRHECCLSIPVPDGYQTN